MPTRAIIGLGTNQGRDWALFVLLFSLGNTYCNFIMMTSQKQEGGERNDPSNKEEETK